MRHVGRDDGWSITDAFHTDSDQLKDKIKQETCDSDRKHVTWPIGIHSET